MTARAGSVRDSKYRDSKYRDSKYRDSGPRLALAAEAWTEFVAYAAGD
ncbi:DUF397 domain-containing protein [Streptomyces sp. NPDC048297]